jgi:signal transduction histidine kinase
VEGHGAAGLVHMMSKRGAFHRTKLGDKDGYFIDDELYDKIIKIYPAVDEASNRIRTTALMFINSIRASNLVLNSDKFSMRVVITESIKELHSKDFKRDMLQLDLNKDFEFIGDYRMFRHVIWNLIKNIYKHSGAKDIWIWLENDSKKGYNEVHVKDNGIGIKSEDLEKIFELSFTTGAADNSTGVGLALCKKIIESLGGSIICESKQGEGSFTEFTISLPKVQDMPTSPTET